MGAQLTATHMQREARGEQGQHSGSGEAEGPGRHLARGLLGCPLSTVTRLPQAVTWSVCSLNTFSLCPSGAPWPTRECYPTPRGAHALSFQGPRASSVPAWDSHLCVCHGRLPSALRGLPLGQHVVPITPEFPQIYNTLSNL